MNASLTAIDLIENDYSLLDELKKNTAYFRKEIESIGYTIKSGDRPIVPIMLGDVKLSTIIKNDVEMGIYVKDFHFL